MIMGNKINKTLGEEELDRLLEEQFLTESRFIAEELSVNDSAQWCEESDEEIEEAYEKLVGRLKTEGVYREESCRSEKPDVKRLSTYRVLKAAGIGIVCAVGVCAAAMNNKTNNTNFAANVKLLIRDEARNVISSNKENDQDQKDDHDSKEAMEQ